MPNILFLDFEAFSDRDIKLVGSYRWMESPGFRALLLSHGFGDVQVHDFHAAGSQALPEYIEEHIQAGGRIAGWSQFERVALNRMRGVDLPHEQYIDVMVMSAEAGYPLALKFAGKAIGCDEVKDPVGQLAIHKFCKLVKGKRIMPEADMQLWDGFVHYCSVDTVLMQEIYYKLPPMTAAETQLHQMDMRLNDRGICLDAEACKVLMVLGEQVKNRLNAIMIEVTGDRIQTIGQVAKIADFCGTTSAGAPALEAYLKEGKGSEAQTLVARLRLAGAKSSTAKLPKMINSLCKDGRSHGVLQFAGTKTKRWAGRDWQPHNLPRESFKPSEFEECLESARLGYVEFVKKYPNPMKAISMMLRGLIIPAPGHELIIADYSAIEARVLCWYAQQEDILQVYDRGGDVYKETGASIFGKKAEDITGDERFLAKTVVLGSGYGLGFAGLQRNLAGYGIDATEEEAKRLTYGYRERFHHVVMWWQEIMGAMRDALAGDDGTIRLFGGLVFALHGENDISIELNTGNKLWYREVQWEVKPAPWDENQMLNVMTARNYSSDTARYDLTHSIIAENICSMTAREILARGMLRCELAGYPPVMSVHDEVILEVPVGFGSIEEVDRLLCEQPWYAKRLPLATEAFRSVRYCK